MKGSIVKIVVLCSAMTGGMLCATSQFRSPLSYENRGVIHHELKPIRDTWWYSAVASEDCKEYCFEWEAWTVAYSRSADRAFWNNSVNCDGEFKNKTTRETTTLSQLWFGIDTPAASFKGIQTLANGMIMDVATLSDFAALSWAFITPKFKYDEKGLAWGICSRKSFGKDDRFFMGKRINLPFKIVEIKQCLDADGQVSETLQDVALQRPLSSAVGVDPTDVEYAYRLDFLSTLARGYMSGSTLIEVPLVQYGTGSGLPGTETQIGNQQITGPNPGTDASPDVPPVYAIRRIDGSAPAIPFRKQAAQVTGAVNADGSGGTNDSVLFFTTNTDYLDGLGQNKPEQSQLWIVPRRLASADQLSSVAMDIGTTIRSIIQANAGTIDLTAADIFLQECGIDLAACERVVGLGDLNTEIFVGFQKENWFVDAMLGILFPTGKKDSDPTRIYFQTTGNNGHFELKLGLEGGWQPTEWFAFRWDGAYHHAFERSEKRAATFKGATIRNIAPPIDVKVKWDYWVVHADFNFFHPCNPELGGVFSYELFSKNKDRVRLSCPETACSGVGGTALDCVGQSGLLDLNLMSERTNSLTHKIRGEVFHRIAFAELFAGASQIIAGRNAMKETEIHLGLMIYF